MTILVRWYGRNDDFSPNYFDEHHGTLRGENADDCWKKFIEHGNTHDLAKYTAREIAGMWEDN